MLKAVRSRIRGLTPAEIAAEVLARARRKIRLSYRLLTDRPNAAGDSELWLSRDLIEPLDDVISDIRERRTPSLLQGLADPNSTAATVKRLFPLSVDAVCSEAKIILEHKIRLFDDQYNLGSRIDWHCDYGTGAKWPMKHYTRTPIILSRGQVASSSCVPERGPDVRFVWELNRLHQFVTLGQAYALTGGDEFVDEFLAQLDSWRHQNPVNFGVNWTVAMEAAIRAVNLIAAMGLFSKSPRLDDRAIARIIQTLVEHGRFIRANLEFRRGGSSNHYLSNLIGLLVIGTTQPYLKKAADWAGFSIAELVSEMESQVGDDGVDYEGSTGYHRLVLEIFTLAFTLGRTSGVEFPESFTERLRAMFDFARNYLKPDGTAPVIGDSDDGRLIRFTLRPAVDHSYLMSFGAALFPAGDFKSSLSIDEEAVWWFGPSVVELFEEQSCRGRRLSSKGFTSSQIFIQRYDSDSAGDDSAYAIIDCGDNGARGHGSHAHSDALSIEVYACGRTLLRDPGTFAYTGSERWRNWFRSTASHNTVRIDGEEISPTIEGWLFALGSNIRPRVNGWRLSPERDLLDAEHYGYTRLTSPVTHRRQVTFEKDGGYWVIEDSFSGDGLHEFEFCFNFDAGLEVSLGREHQVIARDDRCMLVVAPLSEQVFEIEVVDRWVSLSYGKFAPASGIIYRLSAGSPLSNLMALVPCKVGEESKVERVLKGLRG